MRHLIGSQVLGAVVARGERPRLPSTEVWLRALAAIEAAALAEDRAAVGLAVEEALAGLTASELTRVAMALSELAADRIPRALLPAGKRGDRRRRVAAYCERSRLEVTWLDP